MCSLSNNELGQTVLALTYLFMILCLITTAIRIIVRGFNRLVGIDDVFTCYSMTLLVTE